MHRTTARLPFVLPFLLCAAVRGQVAPGDIAVTGFSTTSFGVIRGTAVTGYATPGFQGTGTATSQAILWDPAQPNDFLVGGFGFVGRATITGPGASTYALVTNNVGIVAQMSWDRSGGIVFADSGTDQIRRLEPSTGAVIDLSTGTQPWGTELSAGALDPVTGDYVAGGSGAIYRLPNGGAVAVPVASGLGGYVSAIAFDPRTGEILATVLTVNRFLRVSSAGVVTNVTNPGAIPGPNALDVDHNGDYVAGGGTGQVYRVPYAGGSATFLASNTSPPNAVNGLAVAGGGGFGIAYGQGCAGAAGPVSLTASGPFQVGATVTTTSTNHAPNTLGVLILGFSNTANQGQPLPYLLDPLLGTSNCFLLTSIDATLIGFSGAGSPADLVFPLALSPGFHGQRFYAQHACFEPVAGGLSWSNGLVIQVP